LGVRIAPGAPLVIASDPLTGRIAALTPVAGADSAAVELIVLTNQGSDPPVRCRPKLCVGQAITGLQWRPDSDEVLFTVTDPHDGLAQSLSLWNVRTGKVRLMDRSGGLINGGRLLSSRCAVSHQTLACVTAEADRPPRLERIDLETGRRRILFDPNDALGRDLETAVSSRLIRWTNRRGQSFTGQLFSARRLNDAPPPLFVTYYSCTGFLRGGVGDEWPLASLAENGVSTLCINQSPSRASDRVEAYDQARDSIESIISLLAASREIDPSRVGMGGLSFGSAVTLWVASRSDLLAAASISSPVVSPNYYLFGSLKGDLFKNGLKEIWGLGAPDETPERWRLLSPAFNLDRLRLPILMQMAEQEYVQALDYAIPLIRVDRADLYVFPNEPHQKFQPRHKLAVYERNLDWFRFWLQSYEDPVPEKADQYRR
jgi:dipeptidyl aminopeptidase/acylaminoacyl peptidase